MELRYYITTAVVDQDVTGTTVLRPKIAALFDNAEQRFGWSAILPGGPGSLCLVQVRADDHTALISDIGNDAFPIAGLDAPLSSVISSNQFNTFSRRLSNRGIDTSSLTVESTLLEALLVCANFIQPGRNRSDVEAKV